MSKAKGPKTGDLPLFDLPLFANDESEEAEEQIDLPLAEDEGESREAASFPRLVEEEPSSLAGPSSEPRELKGLATVQPADPATADEEEPEAGHQAPFRDHLASGFIDFGIQLLFLGTAVGSVHLMGIRIGFHLWPPFTALGLVFSFLYWFIPLAFWGQTPGMAWVGNVAVGKTGEPLTFGQTALRWCGALLTLVFAGLPVLLALGGGSLSDRLSESKTLVV